MILFFTLSWLGTRWLCTKIWCALVILKAKKIHAKEIPEVIFRHKQICITKWTYNFSSKTSYLLVMSSSWIFPRRAELGHPNFRSENELSIFFWCIAFLDQNFFLSCFYSLLNQKKRLFKKKSIIHYKKTKSRVPGLLKMQGNNNKKN